MEYTIEYTLDGVKVHNTSNKELTFTIFLRVCDTYIEKYNCTLKPKGSTEVKLIGMDGEFLISLTDGTELKTVGFYSYVNTLNILVSNVEKLCDKCGCNKNCKDESNVCNSFVQILSLSMAYYLVAPQRFNKALTYIQEVMGCSLDETLSCITITNAINGKSDYSKMVEKLSVMFYALFYASDIILAKNEKDAKIIKERYKINQLYSCVKKYGIDIEDVIDEITGEDKAEVFYWVNQNIDTSVETFSSTLTPSLISLNPRSTLEHFKNGYTVPHSTVGKLVFIIKDVEDFEVFIYDALNNDITKSFDYVYNQDLKCKVYLSKNVHAIGNTYFKFKKHIYG